MSVDIDDISEIMILHLLQRQGGRVFALPTKHSPESHKESLLIASSGM